MNRRSSVGSRERAASVVEFAISASVLIAVILGTIDFAFALFDLNSTSGGTREGARQASVNVGTDPTVATSCGLSGVTWSGSPTPSQQDQALRILCRTKERLGGVDASRSRVTIRFEDENGLASTGAVSTLFENRFVVVCVQAKARSISGLYGPILKNVTFMARSRYRLEYSSTSPPFDIATGGEALWDPSKVC